MFENLNWWEIGALLMLALLIFGERLPKVLGDGLKMLRGLRAMAQNATSDLSKELGTDIQLEDLHPKTFIRKHLLSDEEQAELRRPFDDLSRDMRQFTTDVNDVGRSRPPEMPPAPRTSDAARHRRDDPYDADAT